MALIDGRMIGGGGPYDTPLSPANETLYRMYEEGSGRQGDTHDYDLRGAWQAVQRGDWKGKPGHLPDKWKKPNHPTFSDESQYHGVDGHEGGKWGRDGDQDTFTPGKTNLQYHSPAALADYFQRVEPDAKLVLPGPSPAK